eukprot:TRINITY_DN18103_c0_g1_i1.p1 TRINITY_DN18103_c0_g1~~TRINITY_DN18103_c0_g1_i1.p1  ORF type:complete len:488 (+),score=66.80 TRINITY_DN18103_c0_g1_i1:117-1580(+)
MEQNWAGLGSILASFMFLWAMIRQYLPHQMEGYFMIYANRFFAFFYPYVHVKIQEFSGERLKHSEAYAAVESYLSTNSSKTAKRLKAEVGKGSTNLVLSMDDHEQVTDEFRGIKVWWTSSKTVSRNQSMFYPTPEDRRYYKLTFHRRHRQLVCESYLGYVMEEGKAVGVRNRQRRLYTNTSGERYYGSRMWNHVAFEHPATFQTLAMEPDKKQETIDDLLMFSKGKDYYAKIGKAWKRGYLLYGPPGTGKSTMIAAIANFLDYDVYDLELTAVKNNTELRKLLIDTTGKSIIVIEDIDCSLDLSGARKKETKKSNEDNNEKKNNISGESKDESTKVTLSGLLNFIDGLWSACGGERLIIFTTNYVDKLDPALIRRGRMDKHIELSYCSFGGFKVLAKNYLDLNEHPLFERIQQLMEETSITPADVAENLMPKSIATAEEKSKTCLEELIRAMEKAKDEATQLKDNSNGPETPADDHSYNSHNSGERE